MAGAFAAGLAGASPGYLMSGMKVERVAAICLALSACNKETPEYRASVDCATNEFARHIYIDQTFDTQAMMKDDAERARILYGRAEKLGRSIGLSADRIRRQIGEGTHALVENIKKHGLEAAGPMEEKARTCLAVPSIDMTG